MSEARIPALEADLASNPGLEALLKADPKRVLGDYGVDLTDDDAERLKQILVGAGPGIPDQQAVYVAIKI